MIAALLASMLFTAAPPGGRIYDTRCASCHGAQMWGGADGPSLRGVGLAAVDFYLTTGRMPAAVPNVQIGDRDERSGQRLSQDEIRALEDYLAPVVAGGPAIPAVVANGDRAHGRALFSLHCAQCHGFNGEGGAIGRLAWAPSLRDTPIDAVAEAIRAGPGEMPQFGEQQLSQSDLDDVASYVVRLGTGAQPHDAPPLRSSGPVPEGAVGYLAVVVLVAFVFTFWRVDTPPPEREEAVRRDEGGHT
ncbi:MAG TPA: c-type cytochrome [Xanthomonadales bacterium]|nr:c-type cytochrome [Xanthomonadales bacterium]